MKKLTHKKRCLTIAIAMGIIICLLMSGCTNEKKSKVYSIAGTWKATVPMGEIFTKTLTDIKTGASMDYFDFSILTIDVTMIFKPNGILIIELDDDSIVTMAASLKNIIYKGLQNYLNDLITEIDMDITVEDLIRMSEAETGVTIDSIIHKAINEAAIAEHLKQSFNYKTENGNLYTWADGEMPDNERYVVYGFENGNLILKEYVEPNAEKKGLGIVRAMLPVEFKKTQ